MTKFGDFRNQIKKLEDTALQKQAKRQTKKAARPVRKKSTVKNETQENGEPTTAALYRWRTADFRDMFNRELSMFVPGFKPAAVAKELGQMANFLAALDDRNAAPRAKLWVLRSIAQNIQRHRKDMEITGPLGVWILVARRDQLISFYERLIFTENSLWTDLLEDRDCPDVTWQRNAEEGWWMFRKGDDELLVFDRDVPRRVLNPYLRTRMGLEKTRKVVHDENSLDW